MELEKVLFDFLTGDAVLGGLIGTRLFPDLIPQDAALPAVAYQRISSPRGLAHDGPTGFVAARMQFTVTGDTKTSVAGVVRALRHRLHGFRGWMGPVQVWRSLMANEVDGYGFDAEEFTRRVDFEINYKES